MTKSLSDLGEREIINRLQQFMPEGQTKDDTAQLNPLGKEVLVNTDVLVDGVHFSKETTSPEDVGWRAISTNFSDLAASGVEEFLGITIGLVAPPSTEWDWVEGVYKGIKEALDKYGGSLLGGDCSKGKEKLISITALGTLSVLRLHRSNAQPGDWIVASGPHGLSRLGLALLSCDPLIHADLLPKNLKTKAILAHQRPLPPIDALRTLIQCKPKNLPWRAGGTDSSDGLVEAIKNLCISSNCQAVLDPKKLPKTKNWPSGSTWDSWCLHGGEDFELILSIPPSWGNALTNCLPNSHAIGFMQEGLPEIIWSTTKKSIQEYSNFTHF